MRNTRNSSYFGRPIRYDIWKKTAAIQFALAPAWSIVDKKNSPPKDSDQPTVYEPKGAVFLEAANASKEKNGDAYEFRKDNGAHKIRLKLDVEELAELVLGIQSKKEVRVIHDPSAGTQNKGKVTKTLRLTPGNPDKNQMPTFFMELAHIDKQNKIDMKVKISLSAKEAKVLVKLFEQAIPAILGW